MNGVLLTPWSTVLLEKLTGSQLVKKSPAFYWTRRFITAFTSGRHLSLSWASSIQSMPPTSHFLKIHMQAPNIPSTGSHVTFPLLSSHQRVNPGPKHVFMLRNYASFYGEELLAPRPIPTLEDHPCRLSATAYSIYPQLPSILEAVPPSATWGRAMPWWRGPTYGTKWV